MVEEVPTRGIKDACGLSQVAYRVLPGFRD